LLNSSRPASRGGPKVKGTSVIHCRCYAMRYVLGALGGSEAEWTEKAEIAKAEFLAAGQVFKAIIWPTPSLKANFHSLRFSGNGTKCLRTQLRGNEKEITTTNLQHFQYCEKS